MTRAEVLVVGGGIAGLSATWHLARAGVRVHLLEREPLLASHASARNAAIFRQIEQSTWHTPLARRSLGLLSQLDLDVDPVARTGALYVAAPENVAEIVARACRAGVSCAPLHGPQLPWHSPGLRLGLSAAHVSTDGVMDIHGICQALARGARVEGARLEVGAEVRTVLVHRDSVTGVELADGRVLAADVVLLAAGAWAARLGAGCGAPLPIVPHRRHLALLDVAAPLARGPVVWRLDRGREVYFRPESGGVLASPCDEQPWPAEAPATDLDHGTLERRLAAIAPDLARGAVRRAWACLRSRTPDHEAVIGADPRRRGLFWLGALGGRGMTCGLAAGEIAADCVRSRAPSPLELAPARWLRDGGTKE